MKHCAGVFSKVLFIEHHDVRHPVCTVNVSIKSLLLHACSPSGCRYVPFLKELWNILLLYFVVLLMCLLLVPVTCNLKVSNIRCKKSHSGVEWNHFSAVLTYHTPRQAAAFLQHKHPAQHPIYFSGFWQTQKRQLIFSPPKDTLLFGGRQ